MRTLAFLFHLQKSISISFLTLGFMMKEYRLVAYSLRVRASPEKRARLPVAFIRTRIPNIQLNGICVLCKGRLKRGRRKIASKYPSVQ